MLKLAANAYIYKIVLVLLLVSIPPFVIGNAYSTNLIMRHFISLLQSKNDNELMRTGMLMELTLRQIMDTASTIAADDKFSLVESTIDKIKLIDDLTAASLASRYFDNVILYHIDEDYMLASGYGIIRSPGDSPYSWIHDEMTEMDLYQFKLGETKELVGKNAKKYIVPLITKLPIRGHGQNYLIFNINVEKLYIDFLSQLNVDHDLYNYYLADADGNLIFHQQDSRVQEQDEVPLKQMDGMQISRYPLKTTHWNLIGEVNERKLYSDINRLRKTINWFMFIVTTIIAATILLGAKELYKPVRRTIAKAVAMLKDNQTKRGEFELIGLAFDDVLHRNDQLLSQLNENERMLRRSLVRHLMKNSFKRSSDVQRFLGHYSAYLTVGIITIRSADTQEQAQHSLLSVERHLQTSFVIDSFFESERELAVLFQLDRPDIDAFAGRLADCFGERRNEVSIGIGGVYPLEQIDKSYTEAMYAHHMGSIYEGETNVRCYPRMLQDDMFTPLKHPALEELELAIRQHNERTYMETLNAMFADQVSAFEYAHNLYATVSLLLRLYGRNSSAFLGEINELMADRTAMHAVKVKQFLYDKFKSFDQDYSKDINGYVRKIDAFVEKRFPDNFSLDDLAEHLDITKSYLCTLFKQHYKRTPVDYVSEYRVEKAKDLLRTTRTKIVEIGSSVGFNSNSYFTRIFKQYTGITPSEYRELSWNRGDSPAIAADIL
ncbi:MAG: helix-turn-helix domain-containing protein [Paenibacillaceae bacterium]|nr:helix-turn-helix domain-containing protein [Paenibacillaceae bacterium]